jgi:hypothetical protein
MSKNLHQMSKAELIALVQSAQQAQADEKIAGETSVKTSLGATSVEATTVAPDATQQELLASLLVQQLKRDAKQEEGEEDTKQNVEIQNVSGMALNIDVRDPFNGSIRTLSFERTGQIHRVSLRQLNELRVDIPAFFEKGYLNVLGSPDENPNLVADAKAFLEAIGIDAVADRIEQITSIDTLFRLFGVLEELRYAAGEKDEAGRAKTLELRPLSPKNTVLLDAIQRRIAAISPVRTKTDS